jgi:uncharacterized OB-fold protein
MTLPLPKLNSSDLGRFWSGTRAHKLLVQRCARCGYLRWPPTPGCPECLNFEHSWIEIRPEGTLYSFATYHRALDPRFAELIPYTVAYVETVDGPRMIGTLSGEIDSFRVGAHVIAEFDDVNHEVTLVRWRQS